LEGALIGFEGRWELAVFLPRVLGWWMVDDRWLSVDGGFDGEIWVGWMDRSMQKHIFVWITLFTNVFRSLWWLWCHRHLLVNAVCLSPEWSKVLLMTGQLVQERLQTLSSLARQHNESLGLREIVLSL
jgi:hypothetical protein